jgi:hypothetical protein
VEGGGELGLDGGWHFLKGWWHGAGGVLNQARPLGGKGGGEGGSGPDRQATSGRHRPGAGGCGRVV